MKAETVDLDLAVYRNLLSFERKGVHQIASSLSSIEKSLKAWTMGQNGIRDFTLDAVKYDRASAKAMRKRMRSKETIVQRLRRFWVSVRKRPGGSQ